MSAYTPAPWSASCLPNGTEWTVSYEEGDMLADLTGCPNEAANARLIATAPELLACLLDVLDADGDLDVMDFNRYRAAIARATDENFNP